MDEYTRHRLQNWGEWMRMREIGATGYGKNILARLMGCSARSEPGSHVPVNQCEASITDDAVRSLEPELRNVAKCWYVDGLTQRAAANKLRISTCTFRSRIEQVEHGVANWLSNRRHERVSFNDPKPI